jgi:hypothetical protein
MLILRSETLANFGLRHLPWCPQGTRHSTKMNRNRPTKVEFSCEKPKIVVKVKGDSNNRVSITNARAVKSISVYAVKCSLNGVKCSLTGVQCSLHRVKSALNGVQCCVSCLSYLAGSVMCELQIALLSKKDDAAMLMFESLILL